MKLPCGHRSIGKKASNVEISSMRQAAAPDHASRDPRGSKSGRPKASKSPTQGSGKEGLSPFDLCVSLIEAQRTHLRLMDELARLRELERRGLVYREGTRSNSNFVEAFLTLHRRKIDELIGLLNESRARAMVLIKHTEEIETSPRGRFSSRIRRRKQDPGLHASETFRVGLSASR